MTLHRRWKMIRAAIHFWNVLPVRQYRWHLDILSKLPLLMFILEATILLLIMRRICTLICRHNLLIFLTAFYVWCQCIFISYWNKIKSIVLGLEICRICCMVYKIVHYTTHRSHYCLWIFRYTQRFFIWCNVLVYHINKTRIYDIYSLSFLQFPTKDKE
jgi:hypothetical protein